MIIKNTTPVIVPATPSATYPDIWLHEIWIQTPPTGPGQATISWSPWLAGTAETAEGAQRFVISDLIGKLQTDPDFQTAWDGMTAIVNKYMVEAGIAANPEP